jgi:hypothetical protein
MALDIIFKRNPEPSHALGEFRWLRGGKCRQEEEVGIEFIVMQAQEKGQRIDEIYTSRYSLALLGRAWPQRLPPLTLKNRCRGREVV